MAQVISIATQNPISLRPIDKLFEVIDLMAKNSFRRIPIIWEDRLEGILTASDLLKIVHKNGINNINDEIHNFMIRNPVYVYRDTELDETIQLMFKHNLGALPIVSPRDNTLAGIVTERDLVKAFAKDGFADADLLEFITTEPITKPYATTTLKAAIKLMVEKSFRRVILTDSKKNVKAILDASDILRYISDQIMRNPEGEVDIFKIKAKEIANQETLTVNVGDSVANVAKLLVDKSMGGVPVTNDEDELVGVFTERDILRLIGTYNLI